MSNNRDYNFGNWVGTEISRDLPVLETDIIHTNYIIKVSEEDRLEHSRLYNIWSDKIWSNKISNKVENSNNDETSSSDWENLKSHMDYLKYKYLEKKVFYSIESKIKIKDVDLFLKGISEALWDSDICNYKCKPEEIDLKINEDNYLITLYL